MLGRELVGQFYSFVDGINNGNASLILHRRPGYFPSVQAFYSNFSLPVDLVRESYRSGNQHGSSHRVVFCLCQQIGGAQGWVSRFVCYYHRFCRPIKPVDANFPEQQFLGQRDENITRSTDHVNGWNRLGTVRHRSNRLCPSNAENPVYLCDFSGDQCYVGRRSSLISRSANYDFFNACDSRRYGGHEQGRWKWSCASRHIHSDAPHSIDNLPQALGFVEPAVNFTFFVKGSNSCGGDCQSFLHVFGNSLPSGGH